MFVYRLFPVNVSTKADEQRVPPIGRRLMPRRRWFEAEIQDHPVLRKRQYAPVSDIQVWKGIAE
jgi:hypothetical protein